MRDMMKTIVFKGVKDIAIEEWPVPKIRDDKVLIKVDACAICTWEQRVYTGVKEVEFPFIGGHEIAGTILELGKDIDKKAWSVGDKIVVGVNLVCKNCYQCKTGNEQNCEHFDHSKHLEGLPHKGMGGLSSHLLVDPANLFHYDNILPEQASITEPVSCVLHSIETGDIQLGDTVVVIGCGIMGLLHVMLAVRQGARVIASDMDESRLALALKLGASHIINPSKENLETRVNEITTGIKAQVVFDTTPISKVAEDALKCLANNGKLILYSSFYPDEPVSFSPDWLHKSAVKIMGTANSNTIDFMKAASLLSNGTVDVSPFVSEIYHVNDVVAAFESAIKGDKYRVIIKF